MKQMVGTQLPLNLSQEQQGSLVTAFGRRGAADAETFLVDWKHVAGAARRLAIKEVPSRPPSFASQNRKSRELDAIIGELHRAKSAVVEVDRKCSSLEWPVNSGELKRLASWARERTLEFTEKEIALRQLQIDAWTLVRDTPSRPSGRPTRWIVETCLLEAVAVYFKLRGWPISTSKLDRFARVEHSLLGTSSGSQKRRTRLRDMPLPKNIYSSLGDLGLPSRSSLLYYYLSPLIQPEKK